MVFPVVGGDGKPTGYEISNSFRTGASSSAPTSNAYLKNTLSSAATEEKFTVSAWVKLSGKLANSFYIWGGNQPNSSPYQYSYFRFIDTSGTASQTIHFKGTQDDGTNFDIESNALFRDPSAWYHAVLSVDTTQGTASNRVKIYVNGSQITSLQTSNYPSQNAGIRSSSNGAMQTVGTWNYENTNYAPNDDGYISEFYFIDGQALDPTYFGETNDNGVWIPKDYTGTYGTHGVRFEFKQTGSGTNSSGIGADTSGNDNHFAVTNLTATDITADTPTNNFCTMNPLAIGADATLSEGNCQIAYGSGTRSVSTANMGFANGKWYWEWKISAASTDGCSAMPGIGGLPFGPDLGTYLGNNSDGYSYNGEDGQKYSGGANSSYGNNFTTNDIISVAFDADNGNLYFYKNGTIQNSGTAAYTSLTSPSSGFYYPAIGDASGTKTFTAQANFGNAPFSISSGNSDANGYGNFEYAVPSGYYSLCTKNLAEFG
jgi:hypothetical protein